MDQHTPSKEIQSRLARYRKFVQQYFPAVEGSLFFSRLNIYYFTGSYANGVFWLPLEGEPILFCRRGLERAKIETPFKNIVQLNSYRDIAQTFTDLSLNMPVHVAAEMNGLPWSLSNSLMKYLPNIQFLSSDKLIGLTRAKKSAWELQLLREAGYKHNRCLTQLLPPLLYEGMNELEISHIISDVFYSEGHNGILRMETFGEEAYLGHIAIGDSANYPSFFNGPVGLRGVHPAAPFMGAEKIKWYVGSPLTIDNGFTLGGYQTDKTQVYWLGSKSSIPETLQSAHNLCVEIQAMVASQLKPGAIPSNLWEQSVAMASKSPWYHGFMGLSGNKVQFLGHGIGLAIDEYPVIAKGFDAPLEEGMVLAIEPKIGLPGIGMVGTENTFEVTSGGGKSLTGSDFEIIEI